MKRDGFTLLELVLVVALLGILSVTAFIYFMDYRRSYLEVAGQKARADIEYARSLAMTQKGTTFGVIFEKSTNRYIVYEGDPSHPIKDPMTRREKIVSLSDYPGVYVYSSGYKVEFNQYGAPTVGGGGTVVLKRGDEERRITVLPYTGKVVLEYWPRPGGCGCRL